MYENETGYVEYIAPLEHEDGADMDGIQVHPVEVPLSRTVAAFVDAVKRRPTEVAPIQASSLRDAIVPLSQKRQEMNKVREQIDAAKTGEAPRQQASRLKTDFLRSLNNFFSFFKPFRGTLQWIDSHYGNDVSSYFVFVLWITTTNLITMGITFFFGMVPSIFWHDAKNGTATAVIDLENKTFHAEDILTGGVRGRHTFRKCH